MIKPEGQPIDTSNLAPGRDGQLRLRIRQAWTALQKPVFWVEHHAIQQRRTDTFAVQGVPITVHTPKKEVQKREVRVLTSEQEKLTHTLTHFLHLQLEEDVLPASTNPETFIAESAALIVHTIDAIGVKEGKTTDQESPHCEDGERRQKRIRATIPLGEISVQQEIHADLLKEKERLEAAEEQTQRQILEAFLMQQISLIQNASAEDLERFSFLSWSLLEEMHQEHVQQNQQEEKKNS